MSKEGTAVAKSIKKNLFYQSIYQGTRLFIPVILVPVISRALGSDGIGIYSFTSSIVEYFILFSGIGILLYGNREIAMVRDQPKKRNQLFSELFYLKMITTSFSLLVYALIVFLFFKQEFIYYLIQSINILFVFFDVTWFFMGIEDFKKISLVNIFVQLTSFFFILFFVHTSEDLILYMLIKASGESLGFFLIWLFALKRIQMQRVTLNRLYHHIKQAMFYFLPQIGIVVYSTFNRTLLGLVSTNHNVGLYTNAMYIITAITSILTTINLVLLPRISHLFAYKKMKEIMQMIHLSIHAQLFISIPAAFGVAGIATNFVPWFFGSDFSQLQTLLPLFTPIIIVLPMGLVFAQQFLLPLGYSRQYTLSILLGAIVSITANSLLIPFIGLLGAIISILIVEYFITFYQLSKVRKYSLFTFDYSLIIRMFLAGTGMFLFIHLTTARFTSTPLATLFQIILGVLAYLILSLLLNVPYVYQAKETLTKYYKKFQSRKEELL